MAFDPTSLERWSLYVTRLCIGVSGMWPDSEDPEIKRRVLARLARDRAGPRMRVLVRLSQHYPEASELLATGTVEPGSPLDDAILLTGLIQRHMSSAAADPRSQLDWQPTSPR